MSQFYKFGPQLYEILYDAVMNQGHAVCGVRVRVDLVGDAMRGPPRMANSRGTEERLVTKPGVQVGKLALRPTSGDGAVLDGRDTGGIVTAILQSS